MAIRVSVEDGQRSVMRSFARESLMKIGFPAPFQIFERMFQIHSHSIVYVTVILLSAAAAMEVLQFSAGPGAG
jgi:hypothetical protein